MSLSDGIRSAFGNVKLYRQFVWVMHILVSIVFAWMFYAGLTSQSDTFTINIPNYVGIILGVVGLGIAYYHTVAYFVRTENA